jgi:hypothetical protein
MSRVDPVRCSKRIRRCRLTRVAQVVLVEPQIRPSCPTFTNWQRPGLRPQSSARWPEKVFRRTAFVGNAYPAGDRRHSESLPQAHPRHSPSTEVYLRADATDKLEATASLVPPTFPSGPNRVAPAPGFRPTSRLRMICFSKITSCMGTERFKREKPCLTGVAMTPRLAATSAVA